MHQLDNFDPDDRCLGGSCRSAKHIFAMISECCNIECLWHALCCGVSGVALPGSIVKLCLRKGLETSYINKVIAIPWV
jgi:hypothetical protein